MQHTFIVEPRENERPSQLATYYFSNYIEPQSLIKEEDNFSLASDIDSNNKLLASDI
jgi:hypothetical protein